MQLSSAFLGTKTVLKPVAAPHVNPQAPRQVTCMAKKKGVRCIVTLECTEARGLGQTPSRYTTQKVSKRPSAVKRIWTVLLTWVLKSSHTSALTAEPQEHHWQDGVEEIQQILETSHCAQRDQVNSDALPATYTWYTKQQSQHSHAYFSCTHFCFAICVQHQLSLGDFIAINGCSTSVNSISPQPLTCFSRL